MYVSVLDNSLRDKNIFIYDTVLKNGQGIVNGSLVDASIVASHILGSNKFYDTFSDAISKSHNVKQEAGTKTELKCFHSRFNEFLSGRFVVTFDDFVNGNVYASVNHDGPKRFLFFNHYLFLALETYTNEPGLHTKHYQQRRIKLAVIFLAIKLVQGVSHWLHAWMRANHFYTFENEAYTGKVSPPIQTDKYQFGNLEIHVESVLFGGYATLIEPPHPFIFQHTIRMGISSVQLTEFTEGRIIHRRLQINSDLISSTSLGLNDCRTPCITFGPTTEYCPGRPVPTCVVAKVPISSTESTTTSGRKVIANAFLQFHYFYCFSYEMYPYCILFP